MKTMRKEKLPKGLPPSESAIAKIDAVLADRKKRKGRVLAKRREVSRDTGKGYSLHEQQYMLPADPASVAAMVEQVSEAMEKCPATDSVGWARAALAAIGIASK